MRPVLLALFAASLASATSISCSQKTTFKDLVLKTSCGCPKKLAQCLRANVDFERLDEIQACFIASGCELEDAVLSAKLFARGCQEEAPQDELRKRQVGFVDDEDKSTTSAKQTTNKNTEKSTTEKKTTTSPKTTEVKTTEVKTTDAKTTSTPTTASTPTTENTSTPTTATATDTSTKSGITAQSQTGASTTSKLECSVTSMVTTEACEIVSRKKVNCRETVIPSATCAPGVICMDDSNGNPVCLKRDDSLTTSGLIVAIAFGVGIIGVIVLIIVLQCQASSVDKRSKLERAALLGGASKGFGTSDVEAASFGKKNLSSANIPLITPGGTRTDAAYDGGFENSYHDQGGDISGASQRASAPKLHPGLGAINQGYSRVG